MSQHRSIAIAVTLKVDKIMRDTLKMLAHGQESLEMLDGMFVREQDGWKLYHNDSIKWYADIDDAVSNVHDFLSNWEDEIVFIDLPEEPPDEWIKSMGMWGDPFGLGYNWKITMNEPPEKK